MTDRILAIESLTVSFNGFTVLDDLDFAMDEGELRFLIGPNGAGKTTLLDIITGKTRPTSGSVTFNGGTDLSKLKEHDLVRLGIGRKFQTPSIFESLTVSENIEIAIGFVSRITRLFRSLSGHDSDRIDSVLGEVGLQEKADHKAGALSHGERQWLEIAMLLVQEPRLLLLDEPVAGMTRRERDRTGDLLHRIGKHRSVMVVEHDMEFVRKFADTVTVLHLGKVLSEGNMDQVQRDPRVVEAYLGHGRANRRQPVMAASA
jgi:urea transport system ATP-binding protein